MSSAEDRKDGELCTVREWDGEGAKDNEIPVQLPKKLKLQSGCTSDFGPSSHLKGCKWAPDGTCLLVSCADCYIRLFNLPTQLYSGPVDTPLPDMDPVLTLSLGESVYDFCWYPLMSSWNPDTSCFATSCKDHPVQLWDAFDLRKRASYSPHNELDELVSPHSLCFSHDGKKLYCGANKCVRVFETSRPGSDCTVIPTYEKSWGGQKGIISCISMIPCQSDLYAVGSYSGQVGVYGDMIDGAMLLLTGLSGGVTHVTLSSDGNLLFIGFRKSDCLEVWDLRNPSHQLIKLHRPVHTNQRLYFDIYKDHYLLSGTGDGLVMSWDITNFTQDTTVASSYPIHSDSVTGCSVHPHQPLLATTSGHRHFPVPMTYCDIGESEGEDDSDEEELKKPDNSLKIWSLV